jgi:hypothetical protein
MASEQIWHAFDEFRKVPFAHDVHDVLEVHVVQSIGHGRALSIPGTS